MHLPSAPLSHAGAAEVRERARTELSGRLDMGGKREQ